MRRDNRLISFGVICFFVTAGALPAILQYTAVNSYEPVQAFIESSKTIKSANGPGPVSDLYEPLVAYTYRVRGTEYISNRVFRWRMKGDFQWAREIRSAFRTGNSVTAYYNPSSPSDAFLIKRYRFTPFLWVFVPMVAITVFSMVRVYQSGLNRRRNPLPPIEEPEGVFRLLAAVSLEKTRDLYRMFRYLWLLPGGLMFYFYFKTSPPYSFMAYWAAGINAFLCLVFWLISVYYGRLRRYVIEPVFTASTGVYESGQKVNIEIRQRFKKPFELQKAELGLILEQPTTLALRFKEGRPRRILHREWQQLANIRPVDVGDDLRFKAEFDIPADLPATTLSTVDDFPGRSWYFHYKLYLPGELVLIKIYPIAVC